MACALITTWNENASAGQGPLGSEEIKVKVIVPV